MPAPEFRALRGALLAAGIAPAVVGRTLQELKDHFDDIRDAAVGDGLAPADAEALARRTLGSDDSIVAAMAARDALKCWHCRWPRSAAFLRQIGFVVCLPYAPVLYCAHHGGAIARWSASASLGLLVTGAMLFSMQLALA